MFRSVATHIAVACALTGVFATAASAQNPFVIETPAIVTDLNNSGLPPQAAKRGDPNGSTKELGPLNGSSTKISVIHSAPIPMLALTNPNSQVDLNAVWTQSKTTADTHTWYYFAWSRDSSNGSGFISIELQKNPSTCDYTSNATLANCNPWAGRSEGDFILLWDQSGSSRDIYLRVFDENLVLSPPIELTDTNLFPAGTAVAEYSADGFRGEAAIDLTNAGIFEAGQCQSFANTIPGTVTGNSDTADYKDAVLALFPPVSNCGTVIVQKRTIPAGLNGSFPYTIAAGGGNIFLGAVDSNCSGAGSGPTQCKGTLINDGDSNQIDGLVAGTNYTLVEGALSAPFNPAPVSISCIIGTDTANPFPGTAFTVLADATTTCTITNQAVGSPDVATVQHAALYDTANISGILRAPGETAMTVTFRLYLDAACTTEVGSTAEKLANAGLSVPLTGNLTTSSVTSSGVVVVAGPQYRWRVQISGNNVVQGGQTSLLNQGRTTPCSGSGSEVTNLSFAYDGS